MFQWIREKGSHIIPGVEKDGTKEINFAIKQLLGEAE
jgi:hypothetical protein